MDYYLEVTYKNGQTKYEGPLDLRRAFNRQTVYEYANNGEMTGCAVIDEVMYREIQQPL